jgi:hypothetical protein
VSTLHLWTIVLLTRWRTDYRISDKSIHVEKIHYSVLRRKAADCPADDGEAYNQLQSADSDWAVALPLVEEHCIAVLDSFRVVEGEDRYCILDIAVEEEVRFRSYFQIST